jgi:hypothetical protein
LTVTQDGETRWIKFGSPVTFAPLLVNLDIGITKVKVPAKSLPNIKSLHLEVTSLEDVFEDPKYKPSNSVAAGSKIAITSPKASSFGLLMDMKASGGSVSLELSALCDLGNKPVPFKAKELEELASGQNARQAQLTMTKKFIHPKDKTRKEKLAQIDQQISLAKQNIEKLAGLGEIYKTVHGKGKVHLRVYTLVDEHKITLFETSNTAIEPPKE